ncbi:MAG: truB [Bacillales bacterium]|jgi:tRNA pseudouridine55 synthase|nr:truB [Bacillales bacterium]
MEELTGILVLHKPAGFTSHDCIMKVRKILRMKRVGHTGTLDPDVTGVLPICLGRATKIAEYITDAGKEYIGEVTLGFATSTEDASGEIVEEKKVNRTISRVEILQVLESLKGTITQIPPMFSAVKVNGKRLYEYAFKGQTVERPSREVQILDLELLDDRNEFVGENITFSFRVACSKGTYVRTLAVTIGEKLGFPAHMSKLMRNRSAVFTLESSVTFDQISEMKENNTISKAIFPIETGVMNLPKLVVDGDISSKIINGAVLMKKHFSIEMHEPTAVFDESGKLLAIYQNHPDKDWLLKPVKIIQID